MSSKIDVPFVIDGLLLLEQNRVTRRPSDGQMIFLTPTMLRFSEDLLAKAYRITRGDVARNNDLWSDSDFLQYPLFYPRWREFGNLEIDPRKCYGFLMEAIGQNSNAKGDILDAADFSSLFECVVQPC